MDSMQCRIISIGDELLIGDTTNTNARWMGQVLTEAGVEVRHIATVKDDLDVIKREITDSLSTADLVLTTGGLGPTHDDITKQAVAEVFDTRLIVHEPTLDFVKSTLQKRNIPFSESNYKQAEVPACSQVLFNSRGTAPGMWIEKDGTRLVVLPGVPAEMKHLMREKVLPKIRKQMDRGEVRKSRYLLTSGIGESTLSDEVIGDVGPLLDEDLTLAYLPSPWGTRLRVSSSASSQEQWLKKTTPLIDHIYSRADKLIVGEGKNLSLAQVVGDKLRERKLTISAAESCTGGAITNAITDTPGSSAYFTGGVIAYANRIKQQLGVPQASLDTHGAVNKAVALQMARGVAQKLNTDIGISTTGIAGPGGGSPEKPVGTVWVGFWSPEQHFALKATLTKVRLRNKKRTTAIALEVVRRVLINFPRMPYNLKKQRP